MRGPKHMGFNKDKFAKDGRGADDNLLMFLQIIISAAVIVLDQFFAYFNIMFYIHFLIVLCHILGYSVLVSQHSAMSLH